MNQIEEAVESHFGLNEALSFNEKKERYDEINELYRELGEAVAKVTGKSFTWYPNRYPNYSKSSFEIYVDGKLGVVVDPERVREIASSTGTKDADKYGAEALFHRNMSGKGRLQLVNEIQSSRSLQKVEKVIKKWIAKVEKRKDVKEVKVGHEAAKNDHHLAISYLSDKGEASFKATFYVMFAE